MKKGHFNEEVFDFNNNWGFSWGMWGEKAGESRGDTGGSGGKTGCCRNGKI